MTTTQRRVRGFSLIELMVAIAIGLALLALLATVFSNTSGSRTELDRVTRLMENARFAIDSIGDDIRHAGYYGALTPLVNTDYQGINPCTNSTAPLVVGFDPASFPVKLPAPLQGYEDGTAFSCLDNVVGGNDVLAISRASSVAVVAPLSASSVASTNLYIQASQCQTDAFVFKVSNDHSALDLRRVACISGPADVAPVRRFFTRTYFLASCNVCSPSDGVPTLKRLEYVNGNPVVTALAEGVIGMQFEYGFDTDGDGEPNVFRTTPATGSPLPEDGKWNNVVAVRAHLLVRGTEPSNVLDGAATRTFDVGPDHQNQSCTAGYRCRLVSTTFRVNNVAGRRETP